MSKLSIFTFNRKFVNSSQFGLRLRRRRNVFKKMSNLYSIYAFVLLLKEIQLIEFSAGVSLDVTEAHQLIRSDVVQCTHLTCCD